MKLKHRVRWLAGLLSPRSCTNANGNPKQKYPTKEKAERAAASLERKNNKPYDAYKCWFHCRQWHVGGSVTQER
jgi:hypothetical protein